MRRSFIKVPLVAGVALIAAACGSTATGYRGAASPTPTSAPVGAPAAPPTTVATETTGLGSVLVDGRGRALYLFEADTNGMSVCTSAGCVAEWPPLTTAGSPQAAGGLMAGALGTTTRPDGSRQVTYDGHPLYVFAGDVQPGQTSGQGINDNGGLWYAVRTDGHAAVN